MVMAALAVTMAPTAASTGAAVAEGSAPGRRVAQVTPTQLTASDLRTAELDFVKRINDDRRAQRLAPLAENLLMTRVARGWSAVMLRESSLYHNPGLASQVQGPWTRLGENVGRGLLPGTVTMLNRVEHLHGLFMNSEGHRANILGPWSQVGAGVSQAQDGTVWVTVTFLQGPTGAFPLFADAAGSVHEQAINGLWARGVVDACTDGTRFCPTRDTTRAEMASFVARAIGLAPQAGGRFTDVSGPHAGNINALAAAGIVRGCAEGRFCPDQGVTRAQMATFIVQASPRLSPLPGSRFADVQPGAVHSENINALAASGVTLGCTGDRYCPRGNVTRGQIASFLARAFPG